MPISREQLYAEVWAEPMRDVAQRYQVSDVYLARVCRQLRIPHPQRGYWAKVQSGQRPAKADLPELNPGQAEAWYRGEEAYLSAPALSTSHQTRPRPLRRDSMHPVLLGAREHFVDGHRRSYGDNGYLRPKKQLVPDIFVSDDTLSRAFALANALFFALEDQGCAVAVAPHGPRYASGSIDVREVRPESYDYAAGWSPLRPTVAFMAKNALVGLRIYEISERAPARYIDGRYVRASKAKRLPTGRIAFDTTHDLPSGRLCIRAYSANPLANWAREWRETATEN